MAPQSTEETNPGALPDPLGSGAAGAIQAELQGYLDQKGLQNLFVKIVEQLLIDRPENPVDYLMAYLIRNYPKETERFVYAETKGSGEGPVAEVLVEKIEMETGRDSGYGTSEEDEVGEMPEPVPAPRKTDGGRRRVSVSASVLKMDDEKESSFKKFPKTEEEETKLRDILTKNLLCKHLNETDMSKIIAACEKRTFPADIAIITQGDTNATHYFIIDSGKVVVFKNDKQVCEYEDGDAFGELALMYNAPRAATVKTASECTIWQLDQKLFKIILMGSAIKRREKNFQFLSNVEILKEMAEKERNTLADALQEQKFKAGDIICDQGKPGDDFFIIADGTVSVIVNEQDIGELSEGQYFGEIALLTAKPRQATIVSKSSEVTVLSVHRKVFQRVLGPLSEILKRNMKTYSQYVAGVNM